jgi:hypothetical protein
MTSCAETGRWNFKAAAVNMTGQRFGRLVVLRRAGSDGNGRARWLCRCICGGEIVTLRQTLRAGDAKSCGCLRRENARAVGSGTVEPEPPERFALDALADAWGEP